ncbi:MFS family permease [Paenarthrobacter nicotinovorans]|uniref:MFS family permease n=1 Tax=Paenarthrobacter nicotinovorans TaxID=29320 RepID=A0ABT9TT42_PAENI|nr:hypothetical protein [Paenarthrobacter nicotinovorans]MDQ0104855.1 MFS family permease [Paenarthrobacter nicotinovorans]
MALVFAMLLLGFEARREFFASYSREGTQVGSILATAVLAALAALPDEEFHSWGWRLPFLLGAGTGRFRTRRQSD